MEFPARMTGAQGLPTVQIFANDVDSALEFMLKMNLEFMPTTAYAEKPIVYILTNETSK